MDLGIKGKIALVTASSEGLGFAAARALAAEGATVCLVSRNMEKLRNAAEKIKSETPDAIVHTFTADMRKADDLHALCDDVIKTVGDPDILVNNTGGPKPGGFFDLSIEEWEEGYRLLLASTVILYQRLIPAMRKKGWGRIVNITSTTSRQPIAGLILSNAFRPGILGVAKSVANEVGADGVLLSTVMPGLTMTARMEELSRSHGEDTIMERLRSQIPLKRAADPAELGAAVCFLCSDKASFITGSAFAVDGGSIRGI